MLDLIDDTLSPPTPSAPAGPETPLRYDALTTLVLNADHRPIKTMGWRETLNGLVRDIIYPVRYYDVWVRSPSRAQQMPSVAALREYTQVYGPAPLTRRNLMLLYGMRCAFCGDVFDSKDLTRDHLHPRSRGGDNSWENLVPACRPCNQGKGNRTPEEAGLTLEIPLKRAPSGLDILRARLNLDFAEPPHPSWSDYLGQANLDKVIDG